MLPEYFVSPLRVRVLHVADHAVPDISVLNQTLQCMGEIAPSGALVLTEAVHLQHWLPREANPEDPLWVIALPYAVSADLLQLAQIPPAPVTMLIRYRTEHGRLVGASKGQLPSYAGLLVQALVWALVSSVALWGAQYALLPHLGGAAFSLACVLVYKVVLGALLGWCATYSAISRLKSRAGCANGIPG